MTKKTNESYAENLPQIKKKKRNAAFGRNNKISVNSWTSITSSFDLALTSQTKVQVRSQSPNRFLKEENMTLGTSCLTGRDEQTSQQ